MPEEDRGDQSSIEETARIRRIMYAIGSIASIVVFLFVTRFNPDSNAQPQSTAVSLDIPKKVVTIHSIPTQIIIQLPAISPTPFSTRSPAQFPKIVKTPSSTYPENSDGDVYENQDALWFILGGGVLLLCIGYQFRRQIFNAILNIGSSRLQKIKYGDEKSMRIQQASMEAHRDIAEEIRQNDELYIAKKLIQAGRATEQHKRIIDAALERAIDRNAHRQGVPKKQVEVEFYNRFGGSRRKD